MPRSFWDALALDVLFIELKVLVDSGRYGPVRGASVHIASSHPTDEEGCVRFLERIFGSPTALIRNAADSHDSIVQLVGMYGGRWALQCTLVELAYAAPPLPYAACLHGSLSFSRALVEFRWGAERLIATLPESGCSDTVRFPIQALSGIGGSHG